MKTIVIDGKTYTKATDLARDLGYTSDYVGQLCRAGKVEAEQVGRSWYVVADTIKDHQANRYRSNQAKSTAAVRTYRKHQAAQTHHLSVTEKDTARHIKVHTYESDDTHLIPPVGRKGVAEPKPVVTKRRTHSTESENTVRVISYSKNNTLVAEAAPPVQFTGTLTVSEAPVEEVPTEFTNTLPERRESPHQPVQRARQPVQIAYEAEEVSVAIHNRPQRSGYTLTQSISIMALTVVSCFFVAMTLLSFQSAVVVQDGTLESSFTFNLTDAAAALKSLSK